MLNDSPGITVRCPYCNGLLVWTGTYYACAAPPELHGKLLPVGEAAKLSDEQRLARSLEESKRSGKGKRKKAKR